MKNKHAQALGRLGGLARAKILPRSRQHEILAKARAVKAKRQALRRRFDG